MTTRKQLDKESGIDEEQKLQTRNLYVGYHARHGGFLLLEDFLDQRVYMENNIAFHVGNGQFTYRVAAIILYEDNLLLVHNKEFDCSYTVGGKVKFGESTEEAILREVLEET